MPFQPYRNRKPPVGTPINRDHPLWRYADLYLPFLEGGGSSPMEYVRATSLVPIGTTSSTWVPGPIGGSAPHLSSTAGWQGPTVATYSTQPFSLAFWAYLDAGGGGSLFRVGGFSIGGFEVIVNSQGGAHVPGAVDFRYDYSSMGHSVGSPVAVPLGTWHHWAFATDTVYDYWYIDGSLVSAVKIQWSAPTPFSGPFYVNAQSGYGQSSPVVVGLDNVLLLNGHCLSPGEAADLKARPWQLFAPRPSMVAVPTIAPELTAGATVYANRASQVVPLTAFDHSLAVGSSPFSIVGTPPAGVSISAQSVSSSGHGSVTLATGTATGTVSITDGTATATVPIVAPYVAFSPATIPAGHSGAFALAATGYGTSWTSGSPIAPLGTVPVGSSIASSTIASATSATVNVSTGPGAGPLTVSIGGVSGTVQVVAPSLFASTTAPAIVATGSYPIALHDPSALWTREDPTTLFSSSGWPGASISGVTVLDDQDATATLVLGGTTRSSGSVAILDASTSTAASIAVTGIPAGSVRANAACVLKHTSGQAGLVSGKASATIAFRIKVNDATLPIPTLPVSLVSWSSGSGPYATYYPATGQLQVGWPGQSGGLGSRVIALQPGVGLQIALTFSPTAVSAYVNGVLLASVANAGSLSGTCSGLLLGPSGAASGQIDLDFGDVSIWGGYAATAADLAALASGASTPLQVGGGASAWWALGGVAGAVPSLADPGFLDLSGNGNALSLSSGALTALGYAPAVVASDPFIRSDLVWRSGKLLTLGMTSAYTPPGALPRPACFTSVNAVPTVYRNGQAISIGPATGTFQSQQDLPNAGFLLECGSVIGLAIQDGGEGFTAPTVSWVAGSGGGTALALGTPTIATGVATYGIANPGVGWVGSYPSVSVMPAPSGWNTRMNSPIAATGRATAASGALTYVGPGAGGLLGNGSGYAIGQPITLSMGTGTGAQLTPTWGTGGTLASLAVAAGGSKYTGTAWVVACDPTGAGSGAILSATLSGGAVQSVAVVAGGAGYSPATTFAIVPATTFAGTTTSGSASVTWIAAGTAIFDGQGISGNNIPAGATVAAGTAFIADTTYNSNQLVNCSSARGISVGAAISGNNIPGGATVTAISGSTITMSKNASGTAAAQAIVASGATTITLSAPATASASAVRIVAYNPAAVWARVGTYIQSVPVVSSSDDFTGPPSFTVSDSPAPKRAATFLPMMSGVSAGDVVTYDAPANWATPTINNALLGGVGAVTGQPVVNGAGTVDEPAAGGLATFARPMTLSAGVNEGGQHVNNDQPCSPLRNQTYSGGWAAINGGTVTYAGTVSGSADPGTGRLPLSWTSPSVTMLENFAYGPQGYGNSIDGMGQPAEIGPWGVWYQDPAVNTPGATWVMPLATHSNASNSYLNLSGPNVGQPAGTGVVVDPRDIVYSGGQIRSVGTQYSSFGTGYEGAIAVVTGVQGTAAAVTVNVANGAVTGFNVVCPGSFFSGTPTITVFGTKVSGTTVLVAVDIQYALPATSLPNWEIDVRVRVANASGTWNIGVPALVPPDPSTGLPQSFDFSRPLQADAQFLSALTAPTGKAAACVRWMGATEGYGGGTNTVYSADLLSPTAFTWHAQQAISTTITQVRALNADPNSTAYNWCNNKVYGPQGGFFNQTDPPFSITATTTAGSNLVTGAVVPGAGLMAGSTISGPGVPLGPQGQANYIAILVGGSNGTSFRLAYPATDSGTVTMTVTNPPYFSLAPSEIGTFTGTVYNSCCMFEAVTPAPHGLTSEQTALIAPGKVPVPIAGFGLSSYGAVGLMIWVTGPTTFLFRYPQGIPSGYSRVASNQPIDLTAGGTTAGWTATVSWPCPTNGGNDAIPYDAAAQAVAGLPGASDWTQMPVCGTTEAYAQIARIKAANLGPSNGVLLEYGNELWNYSMGNQIDPAHALSSVAPKVAPGSPVLDGWTSDGTVIPAGSWYPGACALLADRAYGAFEAAWAATGMDPARVRRVHGAWWASAANSTAVALEALARAGSYTDHVAIAPYTDTPADPTIVAAFAPAGSMPGAASWPMDAIADMARNWIAYSTGADGAFANQANFAGHAIACSLFGQPQRPVGNYTSSAQVVAVLAPTTISVSLKNGGTGYGAQTTATLYGGGGPTTAITPTISGGVVTGFTGVPTSASWTSPPTVAITDPTGAGHGAYATAAIAPTSVASLQVVQPGVGYGQANATAIQAVIGAPPSGTTAVAGTPVVSGTGIGSVPLQSGGSGYLVPPPVTLYGGGVLASGNYNYTYTFVDSAGNETTIGQSRSGLGVYTPPGVSVLANLLVVRSPSLPAWAAGVNFYLTPPGGQPGSEVLYLSLTRAQWEQAGGWIPFNLPAPSTSGQRAPATCGVPASTIGRIPTLVCYEGGVELPIPRTVPFYALLGHDLISHPSYYGAVRGWHFAMQMGAQWIPGSGSRLTNYFILTNPANYGNMWDLRFASHTPGGTGMANAFATIQGGGPADGHDHWGSASGYGYGNVSPGVKALQDWVDATSPLVQPISSTPRKKRWFSGLGQSAARLTR